MSSEQTPEQQRVHSIAEVLRWLGDVATGALIIAGANAANSGKPVDAIGPLLLIPIAAGVHYVGNAVECLYSGPQSSDPRQAQEAAQSN